MTRLYAAILAGLLCAAVLTAQAKQPPKAKSQKEVDAIMAIQNAPDGPSRLTAIDNLLTKFADTEFKPMVLLMAAQTAQQMNDFEKMVVYAERTLDADPNSYGAMLMLANGYALRTREFDLDKDEKLKKANDYANKALELLKTAEKPNPQITDDQWAAAKKDMQAQAHEALGNAAMDQKKYDAAIAEFKTSMDVAATPDPATMLRLANAYVDSGKPDAAMAMVDRVLAMPDAHPAVKSVARNLKAKLQNANGAKPAGTAPAPQAAPSTQPAPAAQPAPPTVEPKKP